MFTPSLRRPASSYVEAAKLQLSSQSARGTKSCISIAHENWRIVARLYRNLVRKNEEEDIGHTIKKHISNGHELVWDKDGDRQTNLSIIRVSTGSYIAPVDSLDLI